ncbi:hypothetical protein [Microbispora corallina]|uniref:hypothetical protein n=1 Tax=Microbispora corallina TaxID=83302 RepID=UPI0019519469|nr:hypothetical protein [Microbispora corallina]
MNSRFFPAASAALTSAAVAPGLAMENWSMGVDVPAVEPPVQLAPWAPVRSAGTNIW